MRSPKNTAKVTTYSANADVFLVVASIHPKSSFSGGEKRIPEVRLHLQASNNLYREEKSLSHVAMVAKFLDDNKPKT